MLHFLERPVKDALLKDRMFNLVALISNLEVPGSLQYKRLAVVKYNHCDGHKVIVVVGGCIAQCF